MRTLISRLKKLEKRLGSGNDEEELREYLVAVESGTPPSRPMTPGVMHLYMGILRSLDDVTIATA